MRNIYLHLQGGVKVEDEESTNKTESSAPTTSKKNLFQKSLSVTPGTRSRNFSGGGGGAAAVPSPYNTVTGLERLQSIFKTKRARTLSGTRQGL